jgi:membrane protease subunit (stomatin/prohibitin family)
MGLFDFVKGGVERLMIARPDAEKDRIVFKHPDQTFPFWSQLTVDADEVCLFFRDGQYVGSLGPGRHTLQTQNIPFLNALVDRFTGQNVFISELFFVTTRPLYNQTFGDTIGAMRDPELDLRVTPRAFGTYSFRVVDPVRFVIEFVGQTGAADSEHVLRWIRDQLFMGLRTTLTRLIQAGELTFMDLGTAGPEVARSIVASCPDLANVGVQVLEVAQLNLNLSEQDQKRIDAFQDQIVEAKVRARTARIGIAQREAEVLQRQLELDQTFAHHARYLQQLDMARLQQFAAAQALLGVGEGMAQGGQAPLGAAMGSGMGLGVGMGLGAGMAFGPGVAFGPGMGLAAGVGWAPGPGAAASPIGASPPVAPPVAVTPPLGPGEAAAGGAVACRRCSTANPATARFCGECGSRIA